MGEGRFTQGPAHPDHHSLELVHKRNKRRGNLVSSHAMSLQDFQRALAATQPCWDIDEDEERP